MSVAAAQASAFYEQVARAKSVYTFTVDGDFLVFPVHGQEVVPFWSSRSRVDKVQQDHPKYSAYAVSEIPMSEFLGTVLSRLKDEQINIGVNWSGSRLTGYDIAPDDVHRNIEHWLGRLTEG